MDRPTTPDREPAAPPTTAPSTPTTAPSTPAVATPTPATAASTPTAASSPPTAAPGGLGLRAAGFLVTAGGALLAGVGAVLTWVTVGIDGQAQVDTSTPGIDTPDGMIVLAAAVISLVSVLASRVMPTGAGRRALAVICLVAALTVAATAGAFLLTAGSRYEPIGSEELIGTIAETTGEPIDEVRERLDEIVADLGGFTRVGPGPFVALVGGVVGSLGAVLVLAWVTRGAEPPRPDGRAGAGSTRDR